jgi:hypothetical protein
MCNTCWHLGTPEVRIKNEMGSSARGVMVFFGMTIIFGMIAHHFAVPHPKGWIPTIVVGAIQASATCLSVGLRFVLEWLDYRTQLRLEICRRVHDSYSCDI